VVGIPPWIIVVEVKVAWTHVSSMSHVVPWRVTFTVQPAPASLSPSQEHAPFNEQQFVEVELLLEQPLRLGRANARTAQSATRWIFPMSRDPTTNPKGG
jgi:hypothetical protein